MLLVKITSVANTHCLPAEDHVLRKERNNDSIHSAEGATYHSPGRRPGSARSSRPLSAEGATYDRVVQSYLVGRAFSARTIVSRRSPRPLPWA
jgi:hypothetical protein